MALRGGALIELAARGKTDAVIESLAPAVPPLLDAAARLPRGVPVVAETRLTPPGAPPRWGSWVDFPLEPNVGDILRDTTLRVTLPTWLPSVALTAAANARDGSAPPVVDASANAPWGYAPGAAALAIDSVTLRVDGVDVSWLPGDYLATRPFQRGSDAGAAILADALLTHDGTPPALCRSAAPRAWLDDGTTPHGPVGHVPLPLLSAPDGVPLALLREHDVTLRVHLAASARVLVWAPQGAGVGTTDPGVEPWGGVLLSVSGEDAPVPSLPRSAMGTGPDLLLETRRLYVRPDVPPALLKAVRAPLPLRVPFLQVDAESIVVTPTSATTTLALDTLSGALSRIVLLAREATSRRPAPGVLLSASLVIAGATRVDGTLATSDALAALTAFTKCDRATGAAASASTTVAPAAPGMWTLTLGGEDGRQPSGTLSLTPSLRPQLKLTWTQAAIAAVVPLHVIAFSETWDVWDPPQGVAFAN